MAKILCIDTATEVCSVAIVEKERTLALQETPIDRSHASKLAVFVEKALEEAKLSIKDLDAIAVSIGPGSYTGLRIGVSSAKGLAYGGKLPVIAVPTLESMCFGLLKDGNVNSTLQLCPMIDARRMEVYAAIYSPEVEVVQETKAIVVDKDTFNPALDKNKLVFFGNGAGKFVDVIDHKNATFHLTYQHSAEYMKIPAMKRFEMKDFVDVAYFEPFYLKDFVTTTPKKNILLPGKKA